MRDTRDEPARSQDATAATNLTALQRVWETLQTKGLMAAMEELLELSHEDAELRSYFARVAAAPGTTDGHVLRGREEIRTFFAKAAKDGFCTQARAKAFEVEGDKVVVRGSARVVRPDGSFAETKARWTYRFRDGLIDEISWAPRAGE